MCRVKNASRGAMVEKTKPCSSLSFRAEFYFGQLFWHNDVTDANFARYLTGPIGAITFPLYLVEHLRERGVYRGKPADDSLVACNAQYHGTASGLAQH